MSKTDIWMPLFVADYLADTQHLTRDEHGGYLLLLMAYWRNGGPLPDDDKRLAAIVKASPREWKTLRNTLAEFFDVADGYWKHGRADKEIADAAENARKNAERAKRAAEKRWGKTSPSDASSNATSIPNSSPQGVLGKCPSPSPSPKPKVANSSEVLPPQDREDPAAAPHDPVGARALELTVLLRQRGASIAAGNPHARKWAEAGVTDAQALAALETAERRRAETRSTQPVNAGLLTAILEDASRAPPRRQTVHDERAATIAALTGRSRTHEHEPGNIIDVTPSAVAGGVD